VLGQDVATEHLALIRHPLPSSEDMMVQTIVSHLGDLLGTPSAMGQEVRSHGRSRADVCALIGDALVTVEAKRSDWQRAVGQAALNRHVADQSYVALWRGRIPAAATEAATQHGVGIIAVGPDSIDLVIPARMATPDVGVRERIISQLRKSSP
jgi:hypothetical protein